MRIFGKNYKNRLSYYNFVQYVFSAKCLLLHSKKNNFTAENVLLSLLPHFAPIFHFKFWSFC